LRSLAHHPSLSALRSKKSEKKRRKAERGGFAELPEEISKEDWRGLKGSKSVPRDLNREEG
jgi:hypothetical protein